MTLTERINDSLSRGVLNYQNVTKIVDLDKKRHMADKAKDKNMVLLFHDAIVEILDVADMSPSDQLTNADRRFDFK